MRIKRWMRHLLLPHWLAARNFPKRSLDAIEAAVGVGERDNRAEIRFVIEGALPPSDLWHGITPRERAIEVFSQLRVWDTELNTGVLVYVQLADRAVEIVADRGINARVAPGAWEAICGAMETAYRAGRFEQGSVEGVRAIATLLGQHFPHAPVNPNELPNRPVIL